jgi:DNA-binding response OmpR family regulator
MDARPAHLLIVDDDDLNRELLSQILKKDGYLVSMADNGRSALAMLMSRTFDLVLLDIMMPEMNGFQVLEKLKADPDLRHVPVIVVSALDEIKHVVKCIEMGAEDHLPKPFDRVLLRARVGACLEKKRLHDQEHAILQQLAKEKKRAESLLEVIIPVGVALSVEKDFDRLLEMILLNAKQICNADGGTLYLRTADDKLQFEIMRTDSLNFALGGTTGRPIPFAPLRMYDENGQPNHHNVATYAAVTGQSVNIPDAYRAEGFDFSGTRAFDKANGYRSKSFLTIPLKNPLGEVIGILQLLNARDPDTGDVIAFDQTLQRLVESLSQLATVALEAYIREQKLKEQIQELKIVIDEAKKAGQVAEITETEYFQNLREKAKSLRGKPSTR